MKLVEFISNIPEENIALDEVLLQKAQEGAAGETLRFWESRERFVVLGRSGNIEEECFLDECASDGIKVIRRTSGGGTVLQGAGCLNYSLVLSYERAHGFSDVNASYKSILGSMIEEFKKRDQEVEFMPVSDLAIRGRKVSGNAQARKKGFFLHHGTFLYDFDPGPVSKYLKHPAKEPDYRKGRCHEEFVGNIPLSREDLEGMVKEVFTPEEGIYRVSDEDTRKVLGLSREKYSHEQWNRAF